MVAGVVAFAKLTRMVRIAHSTIEIENAIECTAGANPLIHRLARGFPVLAVVISAFVRRQRGAENPDSMLMGAFDDLLQAHDQFLCRHQFAGKRTLFHGGAVRQPRLHVRPTDVVNSFEHDHADHTRLCQDVAVQACQRAYACAVAQNTISTDAFIYDGQSGWLLSRPPGDSLEGRASRCSHLGSLPLHL